jgi:hypothetical protein
MGEFSSAKFIATLQTTTRKGWPDESVLRRLRKDRVRRKLNLEAPAPKPELERDAWDFLSRKNLLPPTREYDAWLHYEFARSYRPVVDAVRALKRGAAKREDVPSMAWYLHSQFPEFPDTPWVRIPPNLREARLKVHAEELRESSPPKHRPLVFTPFREFMEDVRPDQDIYNQWNPEDDRYVVVEINPAEKDPALVKEFKARLKAHRERLDVANPVAREWNPEDTRYVVVEINFAEEDKPIVKEFEARLRAYRERLKKRFNKVVEVRKATGGDKTKEEYEQISLNQCFFPRKRRRQVGKGSQLVQVASYMKQLGALRLMHHYQNDWQIAERATARHLPPVHKKGEKNPQDQELYSERKSWTRSQNEAAEMMLRLSRYWKHNHYFVSLLEPEQFLETFNLRWLASVKQPDWLRAAIRNMLKNEVVVISKTTPSTL